MSPTHRVPPLTARSLHPVRVTLTGNPNVRIFEAYAAHPNPNAVRGALRGTGERAPAPCALTRPRACRARAPSQISAHEGHTGNVVSVGFQRDSKWMYTGSEDGTIKVWDLRTPGPQRDYDHYAPVNTVTLHPNQVPRRSAGRPRQRRRRSRHRQRSRMAGETGRAS